MTLSSLLTNLRGDPTRRFAGHELMLVNFLWDMNRAQPAFIYSGSFFSLKPRQWIERPVTAIDVVIRWLSIRLRRFFSRS